MNFTSDLKDVGFGKFHSATKREWKPCRCVNQSLTGAAAASSVFANRRFNRIALRGRARRSTNSTRKCEVAAKNGKARSRPVRGETALPYQRGLAISRISRVSRKSLLPTLLLSCLISFLFPRPNSLPRKKLAQNSRVACRSERRTRRNRGFGLARRYTCTHGS